MDVNKNTTSKNSNSNINGSITDNNDKSLKKLIRSTRKTQKIRQQINRTRKTSFATGKLIRQRYGFVDYKNIRKLSQIEDRLEIMLKKYKKAGADDEKYSMFLTIFGEEMSKEIRNVFWHSKPDFSREFRDKTKKYLEEVGLQDFDIDDFENYILEMTYFLDWLVKLASFKPEMKDDIEMYAKQYVQAYKRIYKDIKKILETEVVEEESEDVSDLMKAFSKAKIL